MFRRIRVQGHSMLPTLKEGDVLWSNRLVYRFRAPRKGEIVVVDHPDRPLRMIKRIVGVPGDVMSGRQLGPAEYFVAGDNVRQNTGSEAFGPVSRQAIVGLVRRKTRRAA
ncbi:MAG TPA: signal peptidase I [Candidatus Thermoplasmatota archaeon]